MKKLLVILLFLFTMIPTAYATTETESVFAELPSRLYTPPAVSFFAEPSVDEILYKRIEAAILANCSNGALQTSVTIPIDDVGIEFHTNDSTYNLSYLLDIYCNVVYNHPEIGNLVTGIKGNVATEGSTHIIEISPHFREVYNEEKYLSLKTNADKAAYLAKTHNEEAFLQAIDYAYSKAIAPDMTEDWQKLLAIHDYLADTITYSPIIANETDSVIKAYDKSNSYLVYTTYSALVGDRISVCQGYSLAFKLLCDMAGIECGYAMSSNINHIWNIAAVDDNYYHIDATWDDPTKISVVDTDSGKSYLSTSEYVMHNHFLRTDNESAALHGVNDITKSIPYECTDSSLFKTLLFGNLPSFTSCLRWDSGSFWFEAYEHRLDAVTEKIYFIPAGRFYNITSNNITQVNYNNYLPAKKLDAKMYNAFAVSDTEYAIAIDGKANTSADFYAVSYDENKTLTSAERVYVTFNSYGEAVAEFSKDYSKLLLFSDNSLKPLAYAK